MANRSMDSAAIGGAADIGRLAAGQDSRTRWRDGLAARGARAQGRNGRDGSAC